MVEAAMADVISYGEPRLKRQKIANAWLTEVVSAQD